MILLREFLSSRCPVWYTRGSSSDCSSYISNPCDLPGMRHGYGGDLLKEMQGRLKDDIPPVIVLESNYVAFWIDHLVFCRCVLNCSLSFTPLNLFQQVSRSTSPYADAFLLNILRASGSVPALSWSSLSFVAVVHPVQILSQSSAMPSFVTPFTLRSFPCHYHPQGLLLLYDFRSHSGAFGPSFLCV